MTSTLIKHLSEHVGQEVEICGWLYNKRSSGKIAFLIVRDGTGMVQGVLLKSNLEALDQLRTHSQAPASP